MSRRVVTVNVMTVVSNKRSDSDSNDLPLPVRRLSVERMVAGNCCGSPTKIKFLTPCPSPCPSPCSFAEALWLAPVPVLAPQPRARGLYG